MKSNKKRKTLFVAVLMFLFLSLLAGCGGKKTEEAGTERPEYIYVPEYFNLGSSDYIGSAMKSFITRKHGMMKQEKAGPAFQNIILRAGNPK